MNTRSHGPGDTARVELFDAHLHLQDPRLAHDTPALLACARDAGIVGLGCCGTRPGDWDAVAALAGETALSVVPAFGVHPWYADRLDAQWSDRLEQFLIAMPGALVGETGLDALRTEVDSELQMAVFKEQLALAARLGRPVVIHCVRAWGDLLGCLRPVAARLPGFMIHAFSASCEVMHELLAMGATCSFGGTITRSHAKRVRAAATMAPDDRIVIETDAPDLMPEGGTPWRGDGVQPLNHPGNLPCIARELAALRGVDLRQVAELTSRNSRRLMIGASDNGSF